MCSQQVDCDWRETEMGAANDRLKFRGSPEKEVVDRVIVKGGCGI